MVKENLIFENARIIFKNFKGEETEFNRKGDRNFCVVIPNEEMAMTMIEDGWNVKSLRPKDEGEEPTYYIQVAVKFGDYPPNVFMVTSRKKTRLDEESIETLDYAELSGIDLVIRPYNWELKNGSHGVKAYLKTGYFNLNEDTFADKYSDFGDD